ncbi:hypothetical protein [Paracidovorax avenae]|uniref:hypothetical protein n=1 Tax=Paracidovorax avenae TaxID=80867 RepID=UPI000D200FA8|nr:hypothetical protein [Paracidovorax avenae]AVS85501.1 hypothetical protein C8239_12690 [Paracidovorax avenae]AVS96351.1 hypothetical protein C8232_08885 [Paracidovorax avenae]AVT03186.1 hypothetical protein C8243_12320 [Paracidovorax avenae]AVT10132.1 hypothetical protein C8242_12075 [Paracidovorax avenae]
MLNRITGRGWNSSPTFSVSPNSSPERTQQESHDKVANWDLSASPPRAANRPPRAAAESSSSMAPRGLTFSASTKYEGRGPLDERHVSGDGGDPKMRKQLWRNSKAGGLLHSYPDGLPDNLKKGIKDGTALNATPHEGKAVYELYKKMVKEKAKGLM